MKKDLVKSIIKNKIPCVFLSPHQDDAALSCAELLSQLSGKTELTIINFFTKSSEKSYTLSAKKFLQASGYDDANDLYKERKKEDIAALSTFKAKVINFDFEDALFRKKKHSSFLGKLLPEFDHIYPTYRWHIVKKIASNDYVVSEIKKKLQVYKNKKILVFAPYGVGMHADHRIAREVCEELFEKYVLYSDFPYNVRENMHYLSNKKEDIYKLKPDMKKKRLVIGGYKTQVSGLFPDGTIPNHEEVYFIYGSI